jgi:hypothetical protein
MSGTSSGSEDFREESVGIGGEKIRKVFEKFSQMEEQCGLNRITQ